MSDTAKESNCPRPQLWPAAYYSFIPERVSISITKTKIIVFWPYCGMIPSVMQLLSRCAEGGWVSKHTAQQIGKEEHQQSTAAMLLTDCSDNRQGKHSHREGKKRWRGCTEREERCKVEDRKRREAERVKQERWVRTRQKKQTHFFNWCLVYML